MHCTAWRANELPAAMQKLRNQAKQAESIEAKKKHMQQFVDKFRFNAKRASLVQSRIKAIDRLGEVQMMDRDPEYVFNFPFPDCSVSSNVVSFNHVSFHYPRGPDLFLDLDFGMDLETRAAIVGPNGALRALFGALHVRSLGRPIQQTVPVQASASPRCWA